MKIQKTYQIGKIMEEQNMKNEYIVAIDYSANYKPMTIDYKMLKAENLLDAMNEAEQYMDKETVYLLKIMKRSGAAHKVKGVDAQEATYTDVLTNRGNGWHNTDAVHCEQPWMSQMWVYNNGFVDLYYCEEIRPA